MEEQPRKRWPIFWIIVGVVVILAGVCFVLPALLGN